jgi:hypothetical protein
MQDDTIRLLSKTLNGHKSALAKKAADSELAHAIDVNVGDQRMLPTVKTLTLRADESAASVYTTRSCPPMVASKSSAPR